MANPIEPFGQNVETMLTDFPAFGICGWSGSGKTSLLEGVVPHLCKKGLKVAVLKHTDHEIQVDHPGKDSDRLFRSGADVFLKGSQEGLMRSRDGTHLSLAATLTSLPLKYDLVLVEGHKNFPLPKVWLQDPAQNPAPPGIEGVVATLPPGSGRLESFLSILDDWLSQHWLKTPVLGCVLIGGQSSRMGHPKHMIQKNGRTWIERTVEVLDQLTSRVIVAGTGTLPESVRDCDRLLDVPNVRGPMAGILAALRWAPRSSWLVTACDLPLLALPALEWLLSTRAPGVWATLPQLKGPGDGIEPLLAHYDFRARPPLEDLATEGEFSLSRLATHPKIMTSSPPSSLVTAWQDVNTPAELEQVG
ncbi:MAG: molybdopterin-guanine dinucleotide biosynthesis protein B [Acidobacteria bacterium]|nr:molybdopterin-guanine dinucleotide biosynthesis protein B [Acidobacteriota bacterium]